MKKADQITIRIVSEEGTSPLNFIKSSFSSFAGLRVLKATCHDVPPVELYYSADAAKKFGSSDAITVNGDIVRVTYTGRQNDDIYCWEDKVHLGQGGRRSGRFAP